MHLQTELVEIKETLRNNAQLVVAYKATLRVAAKRNSLVFDEANLIQEEARIEHKHKVLQSKRRRTE